MPGRSVGKSHIRRTKGFSRAVPFVRVSPLRATVSSRDLFRDCGTRTILFSRRMGHTTVVSRAASSSVHCFVLARTAYSFHDKIALLWLFLTPFIICLRLSHKYSSGQSNTGTLVQYMPRSNIDYLKEQTTFDFPSPANGIIAAYEPIYL